MKRFTLNIEFCGAFVASYESYNEAQTQLETLQAAAASCVRHDKECN